MCGICGFTGSPDHDLLREMTAALTHRGPDDSGFLEDADLSLGVRRLSIIDVPGGHQPIGNEDGSIWTIYNGEIYNFRALREELEALGHDFNTLSDTETIVHAYEQYDLEFVNHLSGMFAFALWDQRRRRLVLARDRIGMKPLYYAALSGGIAFASEIKALLLHPEIARSPDIEVLRLILAFGYSPDERSPFRGILKLPPGYIMLWEEGHCGLHEYWKVPLPATFETRETSIVQTLKQRLQEAVASHLVSDVPVGIMLSGGLDSTTVAALAREVVGDQLKTFTFSYADEPEADDRTHASEVAEFLSTEHREIFLDGDDMIKLLPQVVYHHDEPKVDAASFPTLATGFRIRHDATVVLVGEGSDEQFGGYYSHSYFARTRTSRGLVPKFLGSATLLHLADSLPWLRKYTRALEYVGALKDPNKALRIMNSPVFSDSEFANAADADFIRAARNTDPRLVYQPIFADLGPRDSLIPTHIDLRIYIPNDISMKIDKMLMAASVEARMPFLDQSLLEFTPRINPQLKNKAGVSKYLLRRAMAGKLPPGVLKRPKQTIRVPVSKWIRDRVDFFGNLAESSQGAKRCPVSRPALARIIDRAKTGHDIRAANHLLALSAIEMWYRIYVDPDTWRAVLPTTEPT